jgi:hypothetical protein
MLKRGCTAEFNSKNNNSSVLLDLYAQAKVYTKVLILSIYKFDLINRIRSI